MRIRGSRHSIDNSEQRHDRKSPFETAEESLLYAYRTKDPDANLASSFVDRQPSLCTPTDSEQQHSERRITDLLLYAQSYRHITRLTDHVLADFSPAGINFFPFDAESDIPPFSDSLVSLVLGDSLLSSVTLLLSTLRISGGEMRQTPGTVKAMTQQCVNLLQERLSHDAENTSDATICAVAGITAIEASLTNVTGSPTDGLSQYENGSAALFNTHILGLRQMICLRGGIEAIRRSSPEVAMILVR